MLNHSELSQMGGLTPGDFRESRENEGTKEGRLGIQPEKPSLSTNKPTKRGKRGGLLNWRDWMQETWKMVLYGYDTKTCNFHSLNRRSRSEGRGGRATRKGKIRPERG